MPQVRRRVDLHSSERNLLPVNHKFHDTRHLILHNINSNTLIAQRRPKSKYHICSIHSVPTTKRPVGLAGNSAVETTTNLIYIWVFSLAGLWKGNRNKDKRMDMKIWGTALRMEYVLSAKLNPTPAL